MGPDRIPKWSIRLLYVIYLDTSGHRQDVCDCAALDAGTWAVSIAES